jgi:hypothetical protein
MHGAKLVLRIQQKLVVAPGSRAYERHPQPDEESGCESNLVTIKV